MSFSSLIQWIWTGNVWFSSFLLLQVAGQRGDGTLTLKEMNRRRRMRRRQLRMARTLKSENRLNETKACPNPETLSMPPENNSKCDSKFFFALHSGPQDVWLLAFQDPGVQLSMWDFARCWCTRSAAKSVTRDHCGWWVSQFWAQLVTDCTKRCRDVNISNATAAQSCKPAPEHLDSRVAGAVKRLNIESKTWGISVMAPVGVLRVHVDATGSRDQLKPTATADGSVCTMCELFCVGSEK